MFFKGWPSQPYQSVHFSRATGPLITFKCDSTAKPIFCTCTKYLLGCRLSSNKNLQQENLANSCWHARKFKTVIILHS